MHNVPRLPDVPTLVSRINELQQAEVSLAVGLALQKRLALRSGVDTLFAGLWTGGGWLLSTHAVRAPGPQHDQA